MKQWKSGIKGWIRAVLITVCLLFAADLCPAAPLAAASRQTGLTGLFSMNITQLSFLEKQYPGAFAGKPVLKLPGRRPRLGGLKRKLRKKLLELDGTFSVYVKDLESGEYIALGSRRMYAASLIKLYAMGAVYQKIRAGKLDEAALEGELRKMIASSDNWCFNDLAQKVGTGYMNNWISARGFKDTKVRHGCLPADNCFGEHSSVRFNSTSVKDCGRFLELVYRGKCVSKKASRKMLEMLKAQTRRTKIPAGIPAGVEVANKTGETDDTSHDAAIVFSPAGDYIIVVMVTAPGKAWGKAGEIAKISEITYKYFTNTQGG